MNTAMNTFSNNVKALLADRGMTQAELADKCGIQRPNISRILSGRENVTIDRAERIAHALGETLSDILSGKIKISA